jgi:predicted acyl esterase
MDEPMLRAWMTASHRPASHHETLPGRWVAEPAWPPRDRKPHRLFLADSGLSPASAPLGPRAVRSPQTLGSEGGEWCPFGRGRDQAGDQRPDDSRSLLFETPPLDQTMEILGAPVVTFDVACDKPVANLVVRLCDVHPSGQSLRVSFGVLNLTHRDSHAAPSPLVPGERYRVRLKLNDCGATFPAGHRIRLALSTAYWPMVWPAPHDATVTILGGALDLPARPPRPEDAALPTLPAAETATPVRDTLGFKLDTEGKYHLDVKDDDPTSAVAEMRRAETKRRGDWQVRSDVWMRLSCTRDAFRLQASLSAHAGDEEVCQREWDCAIPRDLV